MKLPPDAIISRREVAEYLLVRRVDDDKSQFLAIAGYTSEHADRLLNDIREQLRLDAVFNKQTEYGRKYQIRSAITGPNGRTLRVATIWMIERATNETKFVTLIPDKP